MFAVCWSRILQNFRNSHRMCSVRKGVLKNFVKFKGKLVQVFSCEFYKIFKSNFFTEHLLPLKLYNSCSENLTKRARETFVKDPGLIKAKSSHQRCSIKKGVLKNFGKFTGKHLSRCFPVNWKHLFTSPNDCFWNAMRHQENPPRYWKLLYSAT